MPSTYVFLIDPHVKSPTFSSALLQDHPTLQMLDELTRLSSLEMGLQRKTELLSTLKLELVRLLGGQKEKDLRYVEMEEELHQVAGEKHATENAMQAKVCVCI